MAAERGFTVDCARSTNGPLEIHLLSSRHACRAGNEAVDRTVDGQFHHDGERIAQSSFFFLLFGFHFLSELLCFDDASIDPSVKGEDDSSAEFTAHTLGQIARVVLLCNKSVPAPGPI